MQLFHQSFKYLRAGLAGIIQNTKGEGQMGGWQEKIGEKMLEVIGRAECWKFF